MPTVVCPSCGQVSEFETFKRAADEFCSNCDYPLFWSRAEVPTLDNAGGVDTSRRRLPGAAGRVAAGVKVCPSCGEHNLIDVRFCIRCHFDWDPPPPPPEPEPIPVMEVPLPPPLLPADTTQAGPLWPVLLATLVASAVLTLIVAFV